MGPDYRRTSPRSTARDQILRSSVHQLRPSMTTPFKGRIQSIGIGPAGDRGRGPFRPRLGRLGHQEAGCPIKQRVGHASEECRVTGMAILQIKLDNGPGLKVVWAADGRAPGDYQDKGFAWYSPDGEQWTAIAPVRPPLSDDDPTFPMGFGNVVGVSDGFIAQGDADREQAMPLAGRLRRDVVFIGRPDLAQPRPTSHTARVRWCRGWAARSSPTARDALTPGPRRASVSCRWRRSSGQRQQAAAAGSAPGRSAWSRSGSADRTGPVHAGRRGLEPGTDARGDADRPRKGVCRRAPSPLAIGPSCC